MIFINNAHGLTWILHRRQVCVFHLSFGNHATRPLPGVNCGIISPRTNFLFVFQPNSAQTTSRPYRFDEYIDNINVVVVVVVYNVNTEKISYRNSLVSDYSPFPCCNHVTDETRSWILTSKFIRKVERGIKSTVNIEKLRTLGKWNNSKPYVVNDSPLLSMGIPKLNFKWSDVPPCWTWQNEKTYCA